MSSTRVSTRSISGAIWPGRQKMCASSCGQESWRAVKVGTSYMAFLTIEQSQQAAMDTVLETISTGRGHTGWRTAQDRPLRPLPLLFGRGCSLRRVRAKHRMHHPAIEPEGPPG